MAEFEFSDLLYGAVKLPGRGKLPPIEDNTIAVLNVPFAFA